MLSGMKQLFTTALLAALLLSAAAWAAAPAKKPEPVNDRLTLNAAIAWQTALEREAFSPGIIDGKIGPKAVIALKEYQRAHALPVTGECDAATQQLLDPFADEAVESYLVDPLDVEQVTGTFKSWVERSQAKRLGYATLDACVAEKFHCSRALLAKLNPTVDLAKLKAGDTLAAPSVRAPKNPHVERLAINFTEKTIRGFDPVGDVVTLFQCSIARDPEKRPEGSARVVSVAHNPVYLFDPAMWPEVKGIKQKLMIPPGPRNPVGLCWITLDKPGYGIHGTPEPEMIGKTGSHGCFRLTNWDAIRLSGMLKVGTPVEFVKGGAATP